MDHTDPPVISHVEWHAPDLTLEAARSLADEATAQLRRVPGLRGARFFGDFEAGRHYFMLTWEHRGALDAYLRSEEMFAIRKSAMAFLSGAVHRELYVDYTPEAG